MILWNYFLHNLNLSKHIAIPKTKLLSKRTVIEVLYNSWFNESLQSIFFYKSSGPV